MTASLAAGPEASERRILLTGEDDLLRQHHVLKLPILPGAAFVDLAVSAVAAHPEAAPPGQKPVLTVRLLRPLSLRPGQQAEVCTSVERRPEGTLGLRIRSHRPGSEDGWLEHGLGQIVAAPLPPPEWLDVPALQARSIEPIDRGEIYQVYGLTGIGVGPLFQVVQQAWLVSRFESLAELRFPPADRAALANYSLHPALLDGCFQASYGILRPRMLAELAVDPEPKWTMVPYRISNLVMFGGLPEHGYSYVRLLEQREKRDLVAVTVVDASGVVRLRFELLTVRFDLQDVIRAASTPLPPAAPSAGTPALTPRPPLPTRGSRAAEGPRARGKAGEGEEQAPPSRSEPLARPPHPLARPLGGGGSPQDVIEDVHTPILVRRGTDGLRFLPDRPAANGAAEGELLAWAPALPPSRLGNPDFIRTHGVRYAYVVGEMANGIASEELVAAAARARLLPFFGAGGLETSRVAAAIDTIKRLVGSDAPFGFSLLHDVHDLLGSQAVVDLYLKEGIRCVNASAFVTLTPPIVHYRVSGLHQRPDGEIVVPNRVFAKLSRGEVAQRFMEPPPPQILDQLLRDGRITEREAELARHIPLADDVTAEADSGGHTDRQPLVALLPALRALRDDVVARHGYARPIRVGAAGGLGTPESIAAAFTLGADYVLTGSVNQACVEAGTSRLVRQMLAEAGQSDVAMGADAGSFEMGSQVQVLRRGTLFAARSQRLLELYRRYGSLDEIPPRERQQLETTVFRRSVDEIWRDTEAFFQRVDPRQLERAEGDEHHRMALVLRWYLGLSSGWAQQGLEDRRVDFQVWCGPAMGAFNAWVRGSFLEDIDNRGVVVVAENLMHGAASVIRRQWLTAQGIPLPHAAVSYRPRPLAALAAT